MFVGLVWCLVRGLICSGEGRCLIIALILCGMSDVAATYVDFTLPSGELLYLHDAFFTPPLAGVESLAETRRIHAERWRQGTRLLLGRSIVPCGRVFAAVARHVIAGYLLASPMCCLAAGAGCQCGWCPESVKVAMGVRTVFLSKFELPRGVPVTFELDLACFLVRREPHRIVHTRFRGILMDTVPGPLGVQLNWSGNAVELPARGVGDYSLLLPIPSVEGWRQTTGLLVMMGYRCVVPTASVLDQVCVSRYRNPATVWRELMEGGRVIATEGAEDYGAMFMGEDDPGIALEDAVSSRAEFRELELAEEEWVQPTEYSLPVADRARIVALGLGPEVVCEYGGVDYDKPPSPPPVVVVPDVGSWARGGGDGG